MFGSGQRHSHCEIHFLSNQISQATYNWSEKETAGNFKLALQSKAVDWLNYVNDSECKMVFHRTTLHQALQN
jgi:hypothetical protein